jgi:hypothetical protein
MTPKIPEKNKRPGVLYAFTNEGIELPVIDVTNAAFALNLGPGDLETLQQKFIAEQRRGQNTPLFVRKLYVNFFLRKSALWQGLRKASRRYLSGMNTYLMKIGPMNLGKGYTGFGDKQIAASFPATALRLRLEDTAQMIAGGVSGPLAASPGAPLHLLNIAGGHAADSLNALLLLRRGNPQLLADRKIVIQVLDLEQDAPDFGRRALAALESDGAPLHGLDITFTFVPYNWAEPEGLRLILSDIGTGERVVGVSTEGGLFEYGTDQEIISNLEVLKTLVPPNAFVVGSVTRDDENNRRLHEFNKIPIRPRGLGTFGALAQRAGWRIEHAIERAFSDNVRLAKA